MTFLERAVDLDLIESRKDVKFGDRNVGPAVDHLTVPKLHLGADSIHVHDDQVTRAVQYALRFIFQIFH